MIHACDLPASLRKKHGIKGRSKYRNRHTVVDGIRFDSAKEARRWGELRLMEKAGLISKLRRQHEWQLFAMGIDDTPVYVASYVSDFDYFQVDEFVAEDVKSEFTRKLPLYRLKFKLFKANYGFEITEV